MAIKTRKQTLIEVGKTFVISIILALFCMNFILFIATVPSGSMEPTIDSGSKIVVMRFYRYFDWKNRGLEYGDLVVFKAPDEPMLQEGSMLVKRVIGMSGDRISIDAGVVYRNGEALSEPYVKNKSVSFMAELIVPTGEIFVLGDNRPDSYDGRFWNKQTIPLTLVQGEVAFINSKS